MDALLEKFRTRIEYEDRNKKLKVQVPWSWLVYSLCDLLQKYSDGLTFEVMVGDILLLWKLYRKSFLSLEAQTHETLRTGLKLSKVKLRRLTLRGVFDTSRIEEKVLGHTTIKITSLKLNLNLSQKQEKILSWCNTDSLKVALSEEYLIYVDSGRKVILPKETLNFLYTDTKFSSTPFDWNKFIELDENSNFSITLLAKVIRVEFNFFCPEFNCQVNSVTLQQVDNQVGFDVRLLFPLEDTELVKRFKVDSRFLFIDVKPTIPYLIFEDNSLSVELRTEKVLSLSDNVNQSKSRLFLSSLQSSMEQITILVQLVRILQFDMDNSETLRVLVADESASKVLLVGKTQLDEYKTQLQLGHILILRNLNYIQTDGVSYLSTQGCTKFKLIDLDRLKGWLTSSQLLQRKLLNHTNLEPKDRFELNPTLVTIVGWQPLVNPDWFQDPYNVTVQLHHKCHTPIRKLKSSQMHAIVPSHLLEKFSLTNHSYSYYCPRCVTLYPDYLLVKLLQPAYSLILSLDDGTNQLPVSISYEAALDMLDVEPSQMINKSRATKDEQHFVEFVNPTLNSILGKKFWVLLRSLPKDVYIEDNSMVKPKWKVTVARPFHTVEGTLRLKQLMG